MIHNSHSLLKLAASMYEEANRDGSPNVALKRAIALYEPALTKEGSALGTTLKNMGRGFVSGAVQGAAFGWGLHQPPKQHLETILAFGLGDMVAVPTTLGLAKAFRERDNQEAIKAITQELKERETPQSLRRVVHMPADALEHIRNFGLSLRRKVA